MTTAEILTNIGVILGGLFAGLIAYHTKKPSAAPAADTMIATVGLEFGNRMQMDELIKELRRIGDIMENKKQAGIEEMLQQLLEEVDELRVGDRRRNPNTGGLHGSD